MQHRDLYPHEILQDVIDKSYAKSQGHLKTLAILSFLGGGYVSFGYMAYLRHSGRLGRLSHLTRCCSISNLLNLYPDRRRRTCHGEHDDDGARPFK